MKRPSPRRIVGVGVVVALSVLWRRSVGAVVDPIFPPGATRQAIFDLISILGLSVLVIVMFRVEDRWTRTKAAPRVPDPGE